MICCATHCVLWDFDATQQQSAAIWLILQIAAGRHPVWLGFYALEILQFCTKPSSLIVYHTQASWHCRDGFLLTDQKTYYAWIPLANPSVAVRTLYCFEKMFKWMLTTWTHDGPGHQQTGYWQIYYYDILSCNGKANSKMMSYVREPANSFK